MTNLLYDDFLYSLNEEDEEEHAYNEDYNQETTML